MSSHILIANTPDAELQFFVFQNFVFAYTNAEMVRFFCFFNGTGIYAKSRIALLLIMRHTYVYSPEMFSGMENFFYAIF